MIGSETSVLALEAGGSKEGVASPLQCSTLRRRNSTGTNHGRKSRKSNEDCTICVSCRLTGPYWIVPRKRENRTRLAGAPPPRILFSESPGNPPLAQVPLEAWSSQADQRADLLERRCRGRVGVGELRHPAIRPPSPQLDSVRWGLSHAF